MSGNVECLQVVGITGKCGVCRWDFAKISFDSRDPVYFRFTVRHLELRMIQASDNVGNGTGESGVVENRGVAAGISFLCGLELEIWVGGNCTATPMAILRCKITLDEPGLKLLDVIRWLISVNLSDNIEV